MTKKFYLCIANPSEQGYISILRASGRFRNITYTATSEPLVYCEATLTNDGHEAWNALGIFQNKLSDQFKINGDDFTALNSTVIDRLFDTVNEVSIDEYLELRKKSAETPPDYDGIFAQIYTDLWEEEGHL